MELNYKTFGQGEPVVILHGLFGTLDNWQTLARQLAERHTVFIVDQRNHGRSPHDPEMNYEVMAEDLRHFLESHWVYNASVIGHSMGGKTAMQFALHHPDMLSKLVVVDIAPRTYPPGHNQIFEALLSVDLARLSDREEAEALLLPRIPDEAIRRFLLKNLTRDRDGNFAWKINLPVIYRHYADILGPVHGNDPFEGPSLFIRGERSDYVPDADIPRIRQLFPAAHVETVRDAGHWVHADAPANFLKLLTGFLNAG